MAFDGIVTACVVKELQNTIAGGKINRVSQPEKDTIVLEIYRDRQNFRLLLCANPQNSRICLSDRNRENPMTAPAFCMVLRKYLVGATITDIKQTACDRIVTFFAENYSDMGDRYCETLVAEIMGRNSNIVLVNGSGTIVDAIKHIDEDKSSFREVLPARKYLPPPAQDKILPEVGAEEKIFTDNTGNTEAIAKYLAKTFSGFSKTFSENLCKKCGLEAEKTIELLENDEIDRLKAALAETFKEIESGDYKALFPLSFEKTDLEFLKKCDFAGDFIEEYYFVDEIKARANNEKAAIVRTVATNIERLQKKIKIYEQDRESAADFDDFRVKGDILAAYIYMIKGGEKAVVCQNFYDESLPDIEIALDEHKTPAQNIQNYYKKYKKAKSRFDNCEKHIAEAKEELCYMESVGEALEKALEDEVIGEIRAELREQGYIKTPAQVKKRPPAIKKAGHIVQEIPSGYTVWIGKNNIQNDNITKNLAANNDLWFHVKNAPGSHVILRCSEKGGKYTNEAIVEAAKLAKEHSSVSESAYWEVDFAYVKYVKKPSGARPGRVIYTNYKTVKV